MNKDGQPLYVIVRLVGDGAVILDETAYRLDVPFSRWTPPIEFGSIKILGYEVIPVYKEDDDGRE